MSVSEHGTTSLPSGQHQQRHLHFVPILLLESCCLEQVAGALRLEARITLGQHRGRQLKGVPHSREETWRWKVAIYEPIILCITSFMKEGNGQGVQNPRLLPTRGLRTPRRQGRAGRMVQRHPAPQQGVPCHDQDPNWDQNTVRSSTP